MASWGELLDQAKGGEHLVQLYGEDDRLLARHVSRYLAEGVRRGDGLVVIATPGHATAIRHQLGQGDPAVAAAVRSGRLLFLDAREMLDRFLVNGEPDRARFEQVVGGVLRGVRARSSSGRVRAFGEMVALLWEAGRQDSATALEQYWNGLLDDGSFSLLCGYPLDLFSPDADLASIEVVLREHSHLCAGPRTMLSMPSPGS
ncbi:MAG: MEDS domain-containing protein [Gemmatimonadales bacterium]